MSSLVVGYSEREVPYYCAILSFSVPSSVSTARRGSRKRKAGQAPPPSPLLVATKAKEVAEDTLYTLSEILLVGVSTDSSLEREMAEIASSFAATSMY